MAKLVITSSADSIKVVFNDYATSLNLTKASWNKGYIKSFKLDNTTGYIHIIIDNEPEWAVSFDGSGETLQIDTVDGVAPTSNSDLYTKLIALIA